jgi:chemotaxis protein methyltransferase CheR
VSGRIEARDQWLVDELARLAVSVTGFDPEAIRPRAVERVLESLLQAGWNRQAVTDSITRQDPSLVQSLRQVAVVGETFFFRQPEHFELLAHQVIPELLAQNSGQLRAWSAGCASGEETYSLAATLHAAVPSDRQSALKVLGTDLLESNLEMARRGHYRARALRRAGPVLFPTFEDASGAELRVLPDLKYRTRFQQHNLLDPAPLQAGRGFHVILCRNVLVYFAKEAIRTVLRYLVEALEPGGVVMFGTMDLNDAPERLRRIGSPELQVYRRPLPFESGVPTTRTRSPEVQEAAASSTPVRRAPESPKSTAETKGEGKPEEPIAVHLRALTHIERGEHGTANQILGELCEQAPEYVPGLMERALLCMRSGQHSHAVRLMRQVRDRVEGLPAEQIISGPEPLPVQFYTDSAHAFLQRHG